MCRQCVPFHFSDAIMKDLGYGQNSLPLGMILDKQMEYFLDLKNQKLTMPIKVYRPGEFFIDFEHFGEGSYHAS